VRLVPSLLMHGHWHIGEDRKDTPTARVSGDRRTGDRISGLCTRRRRGDPVRIRRIESGEAAGEASAPQELAELLLDEARKPIRRPAACARKVSKWSRTIRYSKMADVGSPNIAGSIRIGLVRAKGRFRYRALRAPLPPGQRGTAEVIPTGGLEGASVALGRSIMVKRLLFGLVCLFALQVTAEAAFVTLAWDPNTDAATAGYVVSYGTQPGVYTASIDVGQANLAVVTNLPVGVRYYFAVQAYDTAGVRSQFSAEVSTDVTPLPVPRNSAALGRTDFDGDLAGDPSLYRPQSGEWFVLTSSSGPRIYQWGFPTDVPVPGDFDGDGDSDLAVWRPSTGEWWIRYSAISYGYTAIGILQWGRPGDTPLRGDFDGDGRADLAVWRPSTGEWWIRWSSTNYATYGVYQWGLATDVPVLSDFDGDGRTDLTVYRPSTGEWFTLLSSESYSYANILADEWGLGEDVPVARDYDGDGRTDLAVFRPSTGTWFIRYSSSQYGYADYSTIAWGSPGDVPIPGDYDNDGRSDVVVYRPSTGYWYLLRSSDGFSSWLVYEWGGPGDVPVSAGG
jgi:FG-GAP-like repeat